MTIEEYLKSLLINFPVPDGVIKAILARRDIPAGSEAFPKPETEEQKRKRELAEADVYLAASTFVNGGGSSKQIGNRRFSEGSVSVSEADRRFWRRRAYDIYNRYPGSDIPPDDLDDTEYTPIYDATLLWGGGGCGGC